VEAAMLVEVQRRNKVFIDLQQLLIQQIRQECRSALVDRVVSESILLL